MGDFNFFERPPFLPLSSFESNYTPLGDEIGRGASGIVKRSTRRSDGFDVAVKMIDVKRLRVSNGFSAQRMRREVDVMLGLRHPNIVEFYAAYASADAVWLVMECVEGGELFDAIVSKGAYSERAAKPIFCELCSAVAYMHSCGVIHRDLKPENVLLTQAGQVKLVDFGLSKLVADSRGGSAARTMVGTPSYLAPEIEELKPSAGSFDLDDIDENTPNLVTDLGASGSAEKCCYDSKVDSWSMGVTLYVMLVGRFPVYRRDAEGGIIGVETKPLRAKSPQVQSLLQMLLAADPKIRITVAEALQDVWCQEYTQKIQHSMSVDTPVSTMTTTTAVNEQEQQTEMPALLPPNINVQIVMPPAAPLLPVPTMMLSSPTTALEVVVNGDHHHHLHHHHHHNVVEAAAQPALRVAALPAPAVLPGTITVPRLTLARLAGAHASVVAAMSLQLPPTLRRAGLVYHERVLGSRALASKLQSTAGLVLETLDDLSLAVDAHEPTAVHEFLSAVRRWTAELVKECSKAKGQNLDSMRQLAGFSAELPEDVVKNRKRRPEHSNSMDDSDPTIIRKTSSSSSLASGAAAPPRAKSLDLEADEDVLELMLPMTADDIDTKTQRLEEKPNSEAVTPNKALSSSTEAKPAEDSAVEESLLLKSLGELHVVFSRMELFWSKVEVSLDAILLRNESLEILASVTAKPQLRARFDERLEQFRQFWSGLAQWDLEARQENNGTNQE